MTALSFVEIRVLREILVVVRGFGVGPKFEHAAGNVDGTCDLATLVHFRRVSYVDDDDGLALIEARLDQLLGLRRGPPRDDGIGGFH